MHDEPPISHAGLLMVAALVAAAVGINVGNRQAHLLAQSGALPVCGDGVCEGKEGLLACPPCAVDSTGRPLGNCDCIVACPQDCKEDANGGGGCASVDCPAAPSNCKYIDIVIKDGCQLNCGRLLCEPVCGNSECEEGENADNCSQDCKKPCPQILCDAPGDGCKYVDINVEDGCQRSCGRLVCEGAEKHGAAPRCGNGKCEDGEANVYEPGGCGPGADSRCLGPPSRFIPGSCPEDCGQRDDDYTCEPHSCPDGSRPARCTDDGHPINYFADPCFKASAPEVCVYNDRKYHIGEQFKDDDGCNVCFCEKNGPVSCSDRACPSHPPPPDSERKDHGMCRSSEDCPDDLACSTEFGDCESDCPPNAFCPEVCSGFCMPRAIGNPDALNQCDSSDQCEEGHFCTSELSHCFDECPLEKVLCAKICAGRCVPDFAHDRSGPGRGTDVFDEFDDAPDIRDGQHFWNPEYEDEVRTVPLEKQSRFSDTTLDTLEGEAANVLANEGIIGGFPDGTFGGQKSVNRAEAAKFIVLALYDSIPEMRNEGRFVDVLEGEWYVKYVVAAARFGIINGNPDGTFRPGNTVNTAEFLKMVSEAFDLETHLEHTYADVPDNAWFSKYAGAAEEYELFPERSTVRLEPERLLTRGEVAIAIYRILEAI